VKVPLSKQSVDLPSTENEGQAREKREELTSAMRRERRAGIKEGNYLKGM